MSIRRPFGNSPPKAILPSPLTREVILELFVGGFCRLPAGSFFQQIRYLVALGLPEFCHGRLLWSPQMRHIWPNLISRFRRNSRQRANPQKEFA